MPSIEIKWQSTHGVHMYSVTASGTFPEYTSGSKGHDSQRNDTSWLPMGFSTTFASSSTIAATQDFEVYLGLGFRLGMVTRPDHPTQDQLGKAKLLSRLFLILVDTSEPWGDQSSNSQNDRKGKPLKAVTFSVATDSGFWSVATPIKALNRSWQWVSFLLQSFQSMADIR
jgi:hypothetical protein